MASKQDREPSLGHAELRLALLLADLERTVETAGELANAGLEEEAIRVIDLQRHALAGLPAQIAADVAPAPPKKRLRRFAFAGVAAVATVVSALAATLGLLGSEPANAAELERHLASVERISDPARRLDALESTIDRIATLEISDPARTTLSLRAEVVARRVIDDNDDSRTPDPTLEEQALEVAATARSLAPASATDGSPLDDLLPGS